MDKRIGNETENQDGRKHRPSRLDGQEDVIKMLSRKGYTEIRIAEMLKVTARTLRNWRLKRKIFREEITDE